MERTLYFGYTMADMFGVSSRSLLWLTLLITECFLLIHSIQSETRHECFDLKITRGGKYVENSVKERVSVALTCSGDTNINITSIRHLLPITGSCNIADCDNSMDICSCCDRRESVSDEEMCVILEGHPEVFTSYCKTVGQNCAPEFNRYMFSQSNCAALRIQGCPDQEKCSTRWLEVNYTCVSNTASQKTAATITYTSTATVKDEATTAVQNTDAQTGMEEKWDKQTENGSIDSVAIGVIAAVAAVVVVAVGVIVTVVCWRENRRSPERNDILKQSSTHSTQQVPALLSEYIHPDNDEIAQAAGKKPPPPPLRSQQNTPLKADSSYTDLSGDVPSQYLRLGQSHHEDQTEDEYHTLDEITDDITEVKQPLTPLLSRGSANNYITPVTPDLYPIQTLDEVDGPSNVHHSSNDYEPLNPETKSKEDNEYTEPM